MCRKSSRMERGVITEIPLYVLRMIRMYSPPVSRPIGVTSHTTPLSIRRGAGGEASVFSVCRRPSVGSKCAQKSSVNSVRSVRDKTPQRVSQLFFFSQKNTEEQNTQSFTETSSQPISQNLTVTFSRNALCSLYAGGFRWARHCAPKNSVHSVRSVREKTHQRERKNSPRPM